MRRITVLQHLYERYKKDPNFEHLRYMSRFVPGIGNVRPHIMFVGTAPSEEDNRTRLPFSGRAGSLLTTHLNDIGVERADTFTTYVLKYRTPVQREIRADEFAWSKGYVSKELAIVRPKVVITFGQSALYAFMPGADLKQMEGNAWLLPQDERVVIIPTLHLAAADQDKVHQAIKQATDYI